MYRYNRYLSEIYTPSSTQDIGVDVANWFVEAAYNYANMKTDWDEGEVIDYTDPISDAASIPYTLSEGTALVSEEDLYALLDELMDYELASGELAPSTDIEMAGIDENGDITVNISRFRVAMSSGETPLDSETWYQRPPLGDEGCRNGVFEHPVEAFEKALPVNYPTTSPAWNFSIKPYYIAHWDAFNYSVSVLPWGTPFGSAYDFKLIRIDWDYSLPDPTLFIDAGNGTIYAQYLWGAQEVIDNDPPKDPTTLANCFYYHEALDQFNDIKTMLNLQSFGLGSNVLNVRLYEAGYPWNAPNPPSNPNEYNYRTYGVQILTAAQGYQSAL